MKEKKAKPAKVKGTSEVRGIEEARKARETDEKIERNTENVENEIEASEELKEKSKDKSKQERSESKKEDKEGKEITAIAKIYATYNNTIIHIVDAAGNTISKASGGQVTKYDRLEASPTVAMFAAKKAAIEAKEKGVTALHVRIRSKGGHEGPHIPGPGAQAALKSFGRVGMKIKSIVDVTPVAYGGSRPPHGRRGRRV